MPDWQHRATTAIDATVDESDQTLKSSSGEVLGVHAVNVHASGIGYLKFFDAASVTVSSATPRYVFPCGPGVTHLSFQDQPLKFYTAIHYAATTEAAAGATAPPEDLVVTFEYR